MYIKLNNNQIEKYPYSIAELKKDNPQTSFPENVNNELLSEWNVYPVTLISQPTITYKQNVVEGTPELNNGEWQQVWIVTDKTNDEVNAINKELRSQSYQIESDPIFFKWQRDEADKQQWLDKVAEIKARYQDIE